MDPEGMPNSDMEPTKILDDELAAAGLDSLFWSKVLKDKLGVTDKKQLDYLDEKDFILLKEHIRFRWEEKALWKLFNISEPSKSEDHTKTEGKPTTKQEDVLAFSKACEHHVTKHKAKAKELEAKLKTVHEEPKETYLKNERTLKDCVEGLMKKPFIGSESKCSPAMSISDEEILKTSSGGLALQGIFKTDKVEDLLKDRQQLIKVDTCKLAGPRHNSHYRKYEFSCYKSHKEFFESVGKLGYSYSVEHDLGFPAVQAKYGLQNASVSSTTASLEDQCEKAYEAVTLCHYIPLASTFIDQLILSDSAKKELIEINELLHAINENENNARLLQHAEKFFQKFGSHASQGPIHFGGTFWWQAHAQGFSEQNQKKVKTMVNHVLDMNCSVASKMFLGSHHLSVSKEKGASHKTISDELNTVVQFCIDKFGGPSATDDHTLWKSSLAESNKTWAVIDRGSTLTPVWHIIRTQHKDEFQDPFRLCTFLMRAHEKITHQRAESTDDITVLKTLDEAKEMMRSVHEWSVSDAENHLRDLLKMKTQIKETTTSFRQWIDVFLSNEALQKFLTDITQYDDDNLKFMTCLVMDTHCHEVKTFPNRAQILQWMRGKPEFNQNKNDMFCSIHQFSDVQKVLEKSFEDFQQIPEKDKNNTKNITCEVTHAINSWIDTMKETDTDLVFLVQSLAKLVGYREDTFHPILGPQEIDFLKNELSDTHRKYMDFRKQSTLKAQAFSLLTALTATYKGHISSIHEKQKLLDAFKHTMKTDIIPDLGKAIADFLCHVNWEEFEQALRLMIAEPLRLEDSSQSTDKTSFSENKQTTDSSEVQHGIESKNTEGFFQHNIGLASPCKEMFKKLDLLKYYPANISNADINNININVSMCNNQVGKEKELWFHFIYKLLTLDVNVRFLCIEPELCLSCEAQSNTLESFINFQDDSAVSDIKQETHIHPMDICMAVFYCSNDFVRQIVFTQLYKCHFALPLLVPQLCNQEIEMPVWPLQMSALKCQSTDQSAVTSSILDMSLPVVSFMRLGSSRISKSNIMNDVINKNRHATFFSRHCKGSTTTRLLLDGVAEISWYLPEGKRNGIFKNSVAFINLHGDACNHPQQVEFLKGLSSVIVLLLPENLTSASVKAALDGFLKRETPIIALFSGMEKTNESGPQKIAAKNRNEAELTKEIIFKCNQYLSKENRKQKLKDHFDQAKQQGFIVGTETEKLGRNKAEMLMNILYGKEGKMPSKNEHLPLQGQMWKDWCNKDKEFHRPQSKKQKSIEQHRAEITQEKQNIRKDQQKKASPNIFMEDFLQYAVKVEEKERLYFFNWFSKCLDDALTSNLVDLKKQYNTAWLKYRESSEEEKGNHKTNISKISDGIQQATIGIQHVFREISQLYESHSSSKDNKTIHGIELDHLPEIAVDWMLSGHPLELMVGDTNYVPIQWVRAVIKKLTHKIGDKRVLVLSVVGLQSSGKSTLLNTTFGLNFAVSSGPCTRGAFMHLLPVEEHMRNQLSDYILVLDTEGLRSTESNPDIVVRNDNELATLIIGISDIALINVMGENLCEIQNILQVCFQALLRMKLVNIRPSCIFVHQNVSDMGARENNQGGRMQLIEKLDEIAKAAAEEENQVVSGFNDIINFDVNRDVFYFKSLLEGDPPMAPPNPSYSQNVQELKKRVLSISDWQPNYKPLSLSELSERVKDIWGALLNENFVFNFRNSLDMGVYSDLEKEYQSWSWQLRKEALETQATLNGRIKSGELSNISESKIKEMFADTYNAIKMNVDKYFRTQKHSDILSQWIVLIDSRLESLINEVTNETYAKGFKEIKQRQLKLELDSKMKQYEKDLFQKSMAAASELRNQTPTDDLIQSEFNRLWIQWTTDLSDMNPKETEIDVQVMVENAVFDRFEKHKNTICNISEKEFKFDNAKHIKFSLLKPFKYDRFNDLGNDISKRILEDTNRRITQKAAEKNEVTENFIHEILGEIEEIIQKCQSSCDLQFTSLYKASISAYVCKKVTCKLRKINEDLKSANDPIKQLMNQKQNYFELYKQYCQGAESVKTFVSVLTSKLKGPMQCALFDMYSIDIADHLKSHHPALKHNKFNLELHIMKQLAEKENFKDYMMYNQNPKYFYREFIRECVVNYIDDEAKVLEALTSSWSQLTDIVLVESSSASENMRETQGNASMWLDQFCTGLYRTDHRKHHIHLSRNDLSTIEDMHIDDAQILQESVARSLKEMLEETLKDPKSLLGSKPLIFKLKEKPVDILFEQLSGCWEQCPFCKAVCTNTIPNHTTDHTVEWHRSQAIGGLFHDHWSLRLWKHYRLDKDAGKPFVIDM
ncbi:interferon-induced very large GTPase 1-like [Triplophysa rosa]|uniref:interferon-induced very large GTPase 1-like n=1 Tax=Triplophysa rosa TaxID=992332 RepID=UPI0025461922|nr:interferon-induced very large GTPase 1-like [Triplophysa rosa]